MQEASIISDIEVAKLLMDPKRNKILDYAADEPVTVKQLADRMGEKPSRLYYHVKKLEDAGFLLLVETKQQGNLIEKYYKSNFAKGTIFRLDEKMASEHSSFIVQELVNLTNRGLSIVQRGLEAQHEGRSKYEVHADASVSYTSMTPVEWAATNQKITNTISKKPDKKIDMAEIEAEFSENERNEKEDYVFVVLSYRLKDQEKLL